jgi:hypothetical protein
MRTDCFCRVLTKRVAEQPSQGLILRIIQGSDSLGESLRRRLGRRGSSCSHVTSSIARFELGDDPGPESVLAESSLAKT